MIDNKLKEIVKKLNIRFANAELSKNLGFSKGVVSEYLNNKKRVSQNFIEELESYYKINYSEFSKSSQNKLNEPQIEYKQELKEKKYGGQTPVRVVSSNAQASWSDAYYSEEYLKDMPTVLIESDENYKGQYLAFEVEGESMEPDYYAGDIVICREVQRHLWSSKLHYTEYDYVIAHGTQGIMLKEITNHNVETGEINCHSLHPAHKDFSLNLKEIAFLYNVVEVRQKGRNKKRNR